MTRHQLPARLRHGAKPSSPNVRDLQCCTFQPIRQLVAKPPLSLFLPNRSACPLQRLVWWIESASPAFHIVESESAVQPLPEVRVLHRHHLSKEFPTPTIGSPFGKPILNPLPKVVAAINHGNERGLIQGFHRANHRQQVEPLALDVGFSICGLELLRPVGRSQYKSPPPGALGPIHLGRQQIVRCSEFHRCLCFIGVSESILW
jgi:hypothetical protein